MGSGPKTGRPSEGGQACLATRAHLSPGCQSLGSVGNPTPAGQACGYPLAVTVSGLLWKAERSRQGQSPGCRASSRLLGWGMAMLWGGECDQESQPMLNQTQPVWEPSADPDTRGWGLGKELLWVSPIGGLEYRTAGLVPLT